MIKLLRRIGHYITAALSGKFDEVADPKVQLEQAIQEAQDQHRRLKEQAANVIANQKQTEMRLNRAMDELQKVNSSDAPGGDDVGRGDQAGRHRQGGRVQQGGRGVRRPAHQHREGGRVAQVAQPPVDPGRRSGQGRGQQNCSVLQKKLNERQKLLSQLDQAKMQEQMNKAMASLTETVGQDVPTLEEVRDKIEQRYATALGTSELQGCDVESRMLEVEQASMDTEAQARLSEIRSQLGLAARPAAETPATTEGTATT